MKQPAARLRAAIHQARSNTEAPSAKKRIGRGGQDTLNGCMELLPANTGRDKKGLKFVFARLELKPKIIER